MLVINNFEDYKCTEKYSTSFSFGILALKPSIHPGMDAICCYVRLADEIVDKMVLAY